MKKRKIIVLTTGGTIDKSYDEIEGLLDISQSLIQKYGIDPLRLPYTQLLITTVMAKDSLLMDEKDRELISKIVEEKMSLGHPIVIIHGTDTMALTARYLDDHLKTTVPIILTGAMKPIGFIDSDGKQNLSEAFLASKLLAPGVYISFHNEIYKAQNVQKLKQLGTFGRIDEAD